MRINGGVAEQRVFGDYGPAAPATVLATLLDGTGTNMVLLEGAAGEPAQLTLTPRTGGATPPPPASYADADASDEPANTPPPQSLPSPGNTQYPARGMAQRSSMMNGQGYGAGAGSAMPMLQPSSNSAVTSPPAAPAGINNVYGSPSNQSPTASSYPTTNSVPLDTIPTPNTTPAPSGIVDSPNPPPAGSDTAAALNGSPAGQPGTTTITPPGGGTAAGTQGSSNLTPEQVFQQLQQRLQQQQQSGNTNGSGAPQ